MASVSTVLTNTIPINITNTALINSDDRKVRYEINCNILDTVLLMIILAFKITIICYDYAKHR